MLGTRHWIYSPWGHKELDIGTEKQLDTVVTEASGIYSWALLFILCNCGSYHSAKRAMLDLNPMRME